MTAGYRPYLHSFLLLLCGVLLAPIPVRSASLVGVIMTGNTSYYRDLHQAFVESLNDGFPAGSAPTVILQRPFPNSIALSNAARKLIAAEVDVIVTYGSPATLAVRKEKSGIPLVYGGIYDPENTRISGPMVTGCGYKVPISSLLRYLRELKRIETLSVIYTDSEEESLRQVEELTRLAVWQKIILKKINIVRQEDLNLLSNKLNCDAVFLTGCSLVDLWLEPIMEILKIRNLPSVGIIPDSAGSGATLTLYHPPADQGRKTAEITLAVLAGRSPDNIKQETLRNTELVFNLKAAKNLDVKIPFQLVAEATRVIK